MVRKAGISGDDQINELEGSAAASKVLREVEEQADRHHGITEVGDHCWLNMAELKQDPHSHCEAAADNRVR